VACSSSTAATATSLTRVLTTVILDVGETLWDETSLWSGWAQWLGVPTFTLYGVIVARGRDHREFLDVFRPGVDWDLAAEQKQRELPASLDPSNLYPDVVTSLQAVADDGWRVVVGGNQPAWFQGHVERLDLPAELVVSSGSLGAAKPSVDFFFAAAAAAGVAPQACVHVGDRVDNDVVAAQEAGMTAVHLRRGPWGYLFADDPAVQHQITDLTELLPLLRSLR
jgi:HAD superfamily hydrolase (TIGR01509 family)